MSFVRVNELLVYLGDKYFNKVYFQVFLCSKKYQIGNLNSNTNFSVKNKFQFLEDNLFRRSVVRILHCGDVLSTAPDLTATLKILHLKSRQKIGRGSENHLPFSSIEALENLNVYLFRVFQLKARLSSIFLFNKFPSRSVQQILSKSIVIFRRI